MAFGTLLLFLLSVYGLTFIILAKHSWFNPVKIRLQKVQPFKSMFQCFFCTAFWPALGLTILWYAMGSLKWEVAFVLPFAGAASAYLINLNSKREE